MSSPLQDQRSRIGPIRRSVRINVADVAPEADLSLPTSESVSNVPPRRSTRKAKSFTVSEQNTVLPSQGSDSTINLTKSRQGVTSQKRKRSGKIRIVVDDDDDDDDDDEDDDDVVETFLQPVTEEDRRMWKGWCELESEPAFFNVMLRDFGVDGIKVQEVFGLEEELLGYISKPIYGLIFLSQFKDDDPTKQEATCPQHIWFANQTTSNACASVALLNIVMNLTDIDLGPTLQSLKDFTATLNPALRGYQVCNHDFIRQIHNSFSRKMDMLNADLALSNDVKAKRSRRKANHTKESEVEQEQNGFHFVAFVPIQGSVWKLDGLDRQPTNLGDYDADWMEIARPLIQERMLQYEGDQIRFNLLALCKSPLLTKPVELAINIQSLRALESRLDELRPDWQQFVIERSNSDSVLRGPDFTFQTNQALLDSAKLSKSFTDKLQDQTSTVQVLLPMREELIDHQMKTRADFIDEIAAVEQDNERALSRRHDYTPMLHTWIRFLAENGDLENLLELAEQ